MTQTDESAPTTKRSRKPLVIMLLVAVLPVVGAYVVYFTGLFMPDSTVNAGSFIDPAPSLELLVSEQEWKEITEDKKWRLLLPVPSPCSDACQQNLYTTRQVHIRLDQKSQRLQRLAVLSSSISDAERQELAENHPRLKVLSTSIESHPDWFNQLSLPDGTESDYYLLVDQQGLAMMVYDQRQHGNEVLKDLKRAIKFSIDYQ